MTTEQIIQRLRLISKHPRCYDVSLICDMAANKLELLEPTIAGQETLQKSLDITQKELNATKRENDYLRDLLSKYGCYVTPGTGAKRDKMTQYDRIKGLTLGEMAKEFEGECNRCRLHGGQVCHIGNCEQGALQYLMSEVKQNVPRFIRSEHTQISTQESKNESDTPKNSFIHNRFMRTD